LYEPGVREFDAVSATPAGSAAPRFARNVGDGWAARLRRFGIDRFGVDVSRFDLSNLRDVDLRVDLGHRIGTRDWWLGAATISLLCALALRGGWSVAPLPVPARAPYTASQVEDAAPDAIGPMALGAVTGRYAPPTRMAEELAEAPERPRIEATARVRGGESLSRALRRAEVGATDADAVNRLVGGRAVKPGTAIDLVLGRRENKSMPRPLEKLGYRAAFDLRIEVLRNEAGELVLKRIPIAVDNTPLRISGTVGSGLARAARSAGVPAKAVADYIQAMGYVIDMQRQVGKKDRYDIVLEHRRAETGETETGGLIYGALTPAKGEKIELLRWGGGAGQFYRANGESARKGLMRTPVNGARQTSGFGMRFHPVLSYSRLHQGTDFGAGYGAPIMAAAGGKIIMAGPHGGHGNYIKILHRPGLATAYAHLSRFAVKNGQQVAQGQVIGYVGSTGLSTGPHLHYEVWLNNKPVNPMSIKFTGGTQLGGGDLGQFKAKLASMRNLRPAGSIDDGDAKPMPTKLTRATPVVEAPPVAAPPVKEKPVAKAPAKAKVTKKDSAKTAKAKPSSKTAKAKSTKAKPAAKSKTPAKPKSKTASKSKSTSKSKAAK
jgi:murein DD-endopeptidase MepM/ murein hydrolase activator NlpD